jgi:hypothetical protein
MNELLAQAYGTQGNVEANNGTLEKTAEAAILDELEKVAAAEGIDLNEFSDDDIIEIISEAMGNAGVEKTAGVYGEDESMEKVAEADFLGRTMAHAFYDELTSIQHGGVEKTASDEEFAQAFENEAIDRANAILEAVGGVEKQSSATPDDEQLDGYLNERAAELLAEAGYDLDAIAGALEG